MAEPGSTTLSSRRPTPWPRFLILVFAISATLAAMQTLGPGGPSDPAAVQAQAAQQPCGPNFPNFPPCTPTSQIQPCVPGVAANLPCTPTPDLRGCGPQFPNNPPCTSTPTLQPPTFTAITQASPTPTIRDALDATATPTLPPGATVTVTQTRDTGVFRDATPTLTRPITATLPGGVSQTPVTGATVTPTVTGTAGPTCTGVTLNPSSITDSVTFTVSGVNTADRAGYVHVYRAGWPVKVTSSMIGVGQPWSLTYTLPSNAVVSTHKIQAWLSPLAVPKKPIADPDPTPDTRGGIVSFPFTRLSDEAAGLAPGVAVGGSGRGAASLLASGAFLPLVADVYLGCAELTIPQLFGIFNGRVVSSETGDGVDGATVEFIPVPPTSSGGSGPSLYLFSPRRRLRRPRRPRLFHSQPGRWVDRGHPEPPGPGRDRARSPGARHRAWNAPHRHCWRALQRSRRRGRQR
jgi:hypothetical protein